MLKDIENIINTLLKSKMLIVVDENNNVEILANGKPIKGVVSIDFTAGVNEIPNVIIEKRVI